MLASGIAQPKHTDDSLQPSHPQFRPHMMQGWTPDFIPLLAEQVASSSHIDGFVAIDGREALRCARELARQEGIFVGISSGATLSGALQVAQTAAPGANILCMLPDTGERYLSTALFEHIAADMNDEELAISGSIPGYSPAAAVITANSKTVR